MRPAGKTVFYETFTEVESAGSQPTRGKPEAGWWGWRHRERDEGDGYRAFACARIHNIVGFDAKCAPFVGGRSSPCLDP